MQLSFADGSSAECDLLVVADGANSKLRGSLLPDETNRYAGITMLYVSSSLSHAGPWRLVHLDKYHKHAGTYMLLLA